MFLETCARELENGELLEGIVGLQLELEDASMPSVVDLTRIRSEFHSDCKREIDFLASRFFEVDLDVLRCRRVPDLELALTNPLLQSEDQLYEVVMSLADEKGDAALVLLRYVQFAFLSEQDSAEARRKQQFCLEEGV